jgi:mRNA interferase RelE/StbE
MRVLFTKSFAKDLRKHKKNRRILNQVQKIIENAEQTETISELTNLKQLKAEGRYYRIRTGDYRIGITIENDEITFVRVLHRKEIYRFFP